MDVLTAQLPLIWMTLLVAALVLHLVRLSTPDRWLHAAFAASAIGLIFVLGARTYGWSMVSPLLLLWVFLALFALVAVVAVRRRIERGAIGLPWLSALIQLGAVAYMFAPARYWKPPIAFLLLLYFVAELISWLRGREEEVDAAGDNTRRPPLFPPKRRRGLTEFALAAAAAAMIYALAVGPRAPVTAPEEAQQEASEPETQSADADENSATASEPTAAESGAPASEAPANNDAASETTEKAAAEPQAPAEDAAKAPAPPAATYTVARGDTFKSIAKRLFGDSRKWRAIANANPGAKSAKLRAGQVLKVPDMPQR